mmetsp:Transcript_14958/g.40357  ORF Transcript_14958/g.40357 Transcript_14958/m.40357 type:complete len:111 (+) Transcript_14958:77-409(+)
MCRVPTLAEPHKNLAGNAQPLVKKQTLQQQRPLVPVTASAALSVLRASTAPGSPALQPQALPKACTLPGKTNFTRAGQGSACFLQHPALHSADHSRAQRKKKMMERRMGF